MDCDICGKREAFALVNVEGAKLNACKGCAKHGKIVAKLSDDSKIAPSQAYEHKIEKDEEDITDGYDKKVKNARESAGLTRKELAARINETESFIDAIENRRLMPTIKVAKKLEKELNISLIENAGQSVAPSVSQKGPPKETTLADLLETQKKPLHGKSVSSQKD